MANRKISQLTNSLTKATVDSADLLPVVDISASETKKMTYQELIQPTDANFRIAGSADNTKLVAFEVDGLTTATTRTITIPDANTTMVGTDTTQTLSNKTLTAPQVNMGSDATGDMYYRTGAGAFARLPIGTSGQIMQTSSGGIPEWVANPAVSDASTTAKGVVELATTSEINAGTGTGGTGAHLVVTPDALAASNYANAPSRVEYSFTAGGTISAYSAVTMSYYQSDGGITYDNKTTNNTSVSSGGGTHTFSFTVGAGSNRALVVFVATGSSSGTNATPTVTYGGVAMTAGSVQTQSTSQKLHSFYLLSPTSGSNSIVVTYGVSTNTLYSSVAAMSYSNVSSVETSQGTTGSGNLSSAYTVNTLGTTIVSAASGNTGTATANCLTNSQSGATNTYTTINSGDSGLAYSSGTVTWNGTLYNLVLVGLLPYTSVSSTACVVASSASTLNGVNDDKYTKFVGFAKSSAVIGDTVSVITGGIVTGLSGLTKNTVYYLSNTSGLIATSAGSNTKKVGIALSGTVLLMKDSL